MVASVAFFLLGLRFIFCLGLCFSLRLRRVLLWPLWNKTRVIASHWVVIAWHRIEHLLGVWVGHWVVHTTLIPIARMLLSLLLCLGNNLHHLSELLFLLLAHHQHLLHVRVDYIVLLMAGAAFTITRGVAVDNNCLWLWRSFWERICWALFGQCLFRRLIFVSFSRSFWSGVQCLFNLFRGDVNV